MNTCVLCKSVLEIKCRKDGKIISLVSDLKEVRNHYSICFYEHGLLKLIVDPGEGNRDLEGKAVDEYGHKFRYRCQVPECPSRGGSDRGTSRAKLMGFREWAIHAGSYHFLVEKVMLAEVGRTSALKQVLAELTKDREAKGVSLDNFPEPYRVEIHDCLLCLGKDKAGLNLSLDPKELWRVRYHYAVCYFDSGVYQSLGGPYLPGGQNMNEDGNAKDLLGREVKYRCKFSGCTMTRQVLKFLSFHDYCTILFNWHRGSW